MAQSDRRATGAQGIGSLVIAPVADGEISGSDRRRISGFATLTGSASASDSGAIFTGGSGQAIIAMRRQRRSNRYPVSMRG